jgi:anti-sigma factor RsiW
VDCQEMQLWLHGYVDAELDLIKTIEIERHLHTCERCAQTYRNQQALRAALRSGGLYMTAPAKLQSRIQAAVRQASQDVPTPRRIRWPWLSLAAALACILVLAWGFGRTWFAPAADDRTAQEVLASHVRSLMADHLADVASSDRHTVKPWFNGKLDFSPPVEDLVQQGFPLIGGRLDYIDNHAVAALVYRRQQHIINLFIWPAPQNISAATPTATRQGYNIVQWTSAGMTYWAVSDLNNDELQEFVHLIQTNVAPTPVP